jgi:hypothetical protein
MEFKGFPIYLKRGIAHALNNYGHKQYPTNSLDQNYSIHGVYIIPSCEGIAFFIGFGLVMQYHSKIQ